MKPIRVGLVGVGKIARDQHIPALRANPVFVLAACASRNTRVDDVLNFATIQDMLEAGQEIDAVAICTPPQFHYEAAKLALERGMHVLLEKPPCTTTMQLTDLARRADRAKRSLYQTWHSQHALGVAPAERWLKQRKIRSVRVSWKENVRQWHPGQTWIWQAGGFGVLDPGINAISILTKILPEPFFAQSAHLFVASNHEAPIAADIVFKTESGTEVLAAFDFRQTGVQTWDIDFETDMGPLRLSAGGGKLTIGNELVPPDTGALDNEYASIYRHFADLIDRGQSDVDAKPFQLTADIFLLAKRSTVEPFED
jgi:D-galactose 1-dehydrogenase